MFVSISIVGVGMFLKSKNPNIKVVLADPQVIYTLIIFIGISTRGEERGIEAQVKHTPVHLYVYPPQT